MFVAELTTKKRWLTDTIISDQTENMAYPALAHSIACLNITSYDTQVTSYAINIGANLMVINSWIFNSNLGKWQMRKTMMNPMKIAAKLSSFFLLDSLTVVVAGVGFAIVVTSAAFGFKIWVSSNSSLTSPSFKKMGGKVFYAFVRSKAYMEKSFAALGLPLAATPTLYLFVLLLVFCCRFSSGSVSGVRLLLLPARGQSAVDCDHGKTESPLFPLFGVGASVFHPLFLLLISMI